MLATIDPETQPELELITATNTETPTTAELVTFLEPRWRALKRRHITQKLKIAPATSRSSHTLGSKVSKPSYSNVATELHYSLCKETHRLFKCDKFLRIEVKQRLNYAKQSRLRFICLQLYVRDRTCSNQVCRQCHDKHHKLLHINLHTRPINRRPTNHNQSADSKGSPTAEVNKHCSFKGRPQNQTLPATAIVELRNNSGYYIPCRAILDRASQSHFITEKCVQRLRLSKTRTRSSIQGVSNSSAVANHCVAVHMRSRNTDWHDSLNCAILSEITGTPATKLDTRSWKIQVSRWEF